MNSKVDILQALDKVLQQRKQSSAEKSYVASLYQGGDELIASKIREEAEELIEAASSGDKKHTTSEATDLLFHLHLMLAHKDISINEVLDELKRRFNTSGIEEKRNRTNKK